MEAPMQNTCTQDALRFQSPNPACLVTNNQKPQSNPILNIPTLDHICCSCKINKPVLVDRQTQTELRCETMEQFTQSSLKQQPNTDISRIKNENIDPFGHDCGSVTNVVNNVIYGTDAAVSQLYQRMFMHADGTEPKEKLINHMTYSSCLVSDKDAITPKNEMNVIDKPVSWFDTSNDQGVEEEFNLKESEKQKSKNSLCGVGSSNEFIQSHDGVSEENNKSEDHTKINKLKCKLYQVESIPNMKSTNMRKISKAGSSLRIKDLYGNIPMMHDKRKYAELRQVVPCEKEISYDDEDMSEMPLNYVIDRTIKNIADETLNNDGNGTLNVEAEGTTINEAVNLIGQAGILSKNQKIIHKRKQIQLKEVAESTGENNSIDEDNPNSNSKIKSTGQKYVKRCYLCPKCGFECPLKRTLDDHNYVVHNESGIMPEPRYSCKNCKKPYHYYCRLKWHMQSNICGHDAETSRFRCFRCGEKFVRRYELEKHTKLVHKEKDIEKRFKCEFCDKAFNKKVHLDSHTNSVHLKKVHECHFEGCSKTFTKEWSLKVHMRIHTDEKPLFCEYCGYSCRQKSALNWHMKSKHNS